MKHILYVMLASMLLVVACDTTTTKQLLDGDFVPADTSAPNNQLPLDGQVVVNVKEEQLDVELSWTGKSGADYYEIQLSRDEDFTTPIPETPITVDAPKTSTVLDLLDLGLDAGIYWWRVRASVTEPGIYSVPTSFDVRENCLYVSFPFTEADPDAKPDDSSTNGNRDNPYQSINLAIAQAYKLGIPKVKVATRGRITPTPPADEPQFAAYEEYFSFKDGVNIEGGWSQDFSERHDFSAGVDDNDYETRLEGKYGEPIIIKEIYASTIVDGISIRTEIEKALQIQYCGRELKVENCILVSDCSLGSIGLYISHSATCIFKNYIATTSNVNDGDGSGIYVSKGDPVIIGNKIILGENNHNGWLYGIHNEGDSLFINNIIVSGKAASYSYGVFNCTPSESIFINNTIISGEVVSGTSIGMYNEAGAMPIAINNIFIAKDPGGTFGVSSLASDDNNYFNNCIYSGEVSPESNYSGITPGSGCVFADPLLDSDYKLTASSLLSVRTGGIIDPFTLAGITPLDEYLLDIEGTARTPEYVAGSTAVGWSMGAYEY